METAHGPGLVLRAPGLIVAAAAYLVAAGLIINDPESQNASVPQLLAASSLVIACVGLAYALGKRHQKKASHDTDEGASRDRRHRVRCDVGTRLPAQPRRGGLARSSCGRGGPPPPGGALIVLGARRRGWGASPRRCGGARFPCQSWRFGVHLRAVDGHGGGVVEVHPQHRHAHHRSGCRMVCPHKPTTALSAPPPIRLRVIFALRCRGSPHDIAGSATWRRGKQSNPVDRGGAVRRRRQVAEVGAQSCPRSRNSSATRSNASLASIITQWPQFGKI